MEILASIIGSVAGNIADSALQPIRRQFGYLISCESNIKSLTEEVQRLDDQIIGVQQLVDAEGRNLREPMPRIQTWLQQARDTSEEIHRFLCTEVARVSKGCCLNGWCPDLRSRYSVSRRANKKTSVVVELIQNGSFPADQIACPARPPRFVSTLTMTTRAFQDFESRVVIMDKVMEALKDDSVNIIRICGAGGVGKTTMASKIVNKVKEEKLFDEVAMAVVSQTPDSKKIRDAIADQLGLKLDQQSEEGRAAQLHARIVKINRFLLVLDDVWDELQCADIGLPSGSEGALQFTYKILFTSRGEDVFLTSGIVRSPTNYVVPTLSEEEAWCLFKESAGSCCESPNILPVAKQIVNECGGLPIAIVTVGNTIGVAGSNEREWSDALRELKRGRHGNRALSCIKLSYNYLKCEELQGFFLLCCLFPEDADIPIETLLRYGIGLGLLTKDNYSIEDARNRIHALVGKLRRIFLLLESRQPEHVRMHDVVRDVGISIGSEDQECGIISTCKYYEKSDEVLEKRGAGRFDSTKLKLLWLSELHPGASFSFIEGMMKLKVLVMSKKIPFYTPRPKLPQLQFHDIENIQTLCLEYYDFKNIDLSAVGTLGSLEILSFYGSSGVWLPSKLGLLSRLRFLDCTNTCLCPSLKVSYGVLSGLKQLEELYFGSNKVEWEMEEEGKEGVNARLSELKCLSNLTTLTITLPKAQLIDPKALHFEKLVRFEIDIGCENNWQEENHPFRNRLAIAVQERLDHQMIILVNNLMKITEFLHLEGKFLKNLFDLIHGESLRQLKGLSIKLLESDPNGVGLEYVDNPVADCTDSTFPLLESLHLVGLNCLKEISSKKGFTGGSPSFSNLRFLIVTSCNTLKYILPLNVARALLQLKSLEVYSCDMIEEVFSMENSLEGEGAVAGTIAVELPQLCNMVLSYLPNLTNLCKSAVAFELPQLKNLELRCLPELKSLDSRALLFYKAEVKEAKDDESSGSSNTLFPSYWMQQLQSLQVLNVEKCDSVEVLFDLDNMDNVEEGQLENASNLVLPQLEEVHLDYLPKLKLVWENGVQASRGFQNLRILEVSKCDSMEHIVGEGKEEDKEMVMEAINVLFPRLFRLQLTELENLVSFFGGNKYTLAWMSMKELILHGCPSIQCVLSLSSTARSVLFPELYNLRIANCSMMEEIFAMEETNISRTLFPNLKHLTLEDNANLKRVFKGIDAFNANEFSLAGITIRGCPKLGPSSSYYSLLNSLELREADVSFEKQKLINRAEMRTLQASVSSPEMFSGPKFLLIDGVESLMDMLIWDRKSPPGYFSNLRSMELKNLSNFPIAAWLHFLRSVPKLERLNISSCGSVEVIFGLDQGQNVAQLPQLTILCLTSLDKLTCIWMNGIPGSIQRFQNLRELYVGKCHNLRNLLTPSMAKHLVNLIIFAVQNCNVVKDIVNLQEICVAECKVIEEIGTGTIEFPRVTYLILQNLPNLTSFCSTRGYTFNWPSLRKTLITGCPRLETFTLAVPKTPMLEEVETESKKWPLVENLNATVQLIFKEKRSEVGIEEDAITQDQNGIDEAHEILTQEAIDVGKEHDTCMQEQSNATKSI